MPLILALNSSGDAFSAALGNAALVPGAALANPDCRMQQDGSQSAAALPLIKDLLAARGIALRQCDAFAFAAGPGKFSALRLACALAASFAYACQKPLLAVPTFCALAQANYGDGPDGPDDPDSDQPDDLSVKCLLPAHRDHVYYAICRRRNSHWRVTRAALRRASAAAAPNKILRHACGAGCAAAPTLVADAECATAAPYPTARAVWRIAAAMLANNATTDPLECQPIYLRQKVAHTIKERAKQRQCSQTS